MSDDGEPLDEKARRIVEARLKLRERFKMRMQASPARPTRRRWARGLPTATACRGCPPGQHESKSWPVLDLGVKPLVSTASWRLTVDGAVEEPLTLDWAAS